jgi:hypothetical protein
MGQAITQIWGTGLGQQATAIRSPNFLCIFLSFYSFLNPGGKNLHLSARSHEFFAADIRRGELRVTPQRYDGVAVPTLFPWRK